MTTDSFSDGGAYMQTGSAIKHGLALAAAGADIVDVGGESTRPGAGRISAEDELRRVLPVVRELVASNITVSVDTMRSKVAGPVLEAGAHAINDVSGGLADPGMARLVARAEVPYIAMHWRRPSADMQNHAVYNDIVTEVVEELGRRLEALVVAGIHPERILVDPGLGFAKLAEHNWELLRRMDCLRALGRPILIGASRKSFLGALLTTDDGPPPPRARDGATAAVSALAAAAGAFCVRVHDVKPTVDAVRVAAAWTSTSGAAHDRESQ